jgi:starch synthase
MKVLFCVSEMAPFVKTGGLADVAGALPLALGKLDVEVRVMMPKYKTVTTSPGHQVTSLKKDIEAAKIGKNVLVYLINNDKYFDRDGLYGDALGDYPDNLERFSFYCRRTIEALKEINFKPDVIHCHDWQSALIPVYLKHKYRKDDFYAVIKTIFTIHNLAYQGLFAEEEYPKLELDWSLFGIEGLEFYGKINILKGGLLSSDLLNTVSPTYACEIQTREFGCGLDGVLKKRKNDLFGILNGLDYDYWNPHYDGYIYRRYSAKDIEGKYFNKHMLQKECGMQVADDVPLCGIVSRLASQKGLDLIAKGIEELVRYAQIIVLGVGDMKYQNLLRDMARKFPNRVSAFIRFDEALAHKIYAGADIFLMPSHYEPCGLGQMVALRYGTIPLVFKTGGLADTVGSDNGFMFDRYTKEAFIETFRRAISTYKNKSSWQKLVKNAFTYNFSWEKSAKEYIRLYEKLTQPSRL